MGRLMHFGTDDRIAAPRLRGSVPSNGVIWRAFLVAAALLALVMAAGGAGAQSAGQTEITGQVDIIHIDYFEPGRPEFQYFIEDEATGERTRLRFPRGAPVGLRSGDELTVRGTRRDGVLDVEQTAGSGDSSQLDSGLDAAAAIERKTLVIMVDLSDARASDFYTLGQVTGQMYTGTRNVDGLYRASSHGQLGFSPVNNDGTNDVIGPLLIDASGTTCDFYDWAQKADAAADALPGIDLSQYDHRVYILPRYNALGTPDDICGWAGVANVGCNRSDRYSPAFCRSWIAEGESGMVYAHELGHNLYMAHASIDPDNDGVIVNTTSNVYGDYSDPMGLSRNWHVFNAAHTQQMNWFDADNTLFDVQAGGVYALYPMERDGASPPGTRALRIQSATGDYYYLSWRQALGTYTGLSSTYTRGLNIHRYLAGYSNTKFITSLADGGSFGDTDLGMTITQNGVNGSGALEIEITFGCASADPSVSLSPSYAAVDGSGSATYTVNLTNNDSAACDPRTFAVAETNWNLYSTTTTTLGTGVGWSGSFTVGATDRAFALDAGNMLRVQADLGDGPATSTATFFIDTIAPGVPGDVAVSWNKKGNGSVTWTAATDAGSGIDYYVVMKNGTAIDTTAGTSYSISGAVDGYVFAVLSVDKVGHKSPTVDAAKATKGGGKGGGGKDGGGGGGKPCNPKKESC